ncbi:Hypothetical predicted protein [Podarcis lilfordi]|uniref:Uncharacterized protein n=1 Tax=Podarcis lilfordi TaxID=74358 RepID=A0AA35KN63_9SAUR|nr:Hypothetical predicted protein [Podarcis lilfordi]
MRGLPADLASDDGSQCMVHTAWELCGDGLMDGLLINNISEWAAASRPSECMQSAFSLQVQR